MIRLILLLHFLLFLGGSTNRAASRIYQIDCFLLDLSGTIHRNLPGGLCLFQKDGSAIYASSKSGSLVKVQPDGQNAWEIPLKVHHELSLTRDERILLISESSREYLGDKDVRFEVFKIFNQKGEELASWDTHDHFNELIKILNIAGKGLPRRMEIKFQRNHPFFEYTHANSFKEIPPNPLYPQLPFMKPGNYILGMNCLGLFLFLDPTLTTIVDVYHYQDFLACNTHDVQVLPNGHILHLLNYTKNEGDGMRLVEIDPLTHKPVWEFKNPLSDKLFSNYQGSVQLLDNGNLLYIDRGQIDNKGPVEITRDGRIVNAFDMTKMPKSSGFILYRARSYPDFLSYLKNSW